MTEPNEPDEYVIETINCMQGNHHLCNGKKVTQMGKFDCTCKCHVKDQ